MSRTKDSTFIEQFNQYSEYIFEWAKSKGWWLDDLSQVNQAEKLMLMVTELAEACEALRHGNPPDDKIPEFSGLEAELADTVIRIMDFSAAFDLNLAKAIVAKMKYNENRKHKHGGKEF